MSCFILSNDHIGYLVNLGYQLDIGGVTVGNTYQSLALTDSLDRLRVTAELVNANRISVASRYDQKAHPISEVPVYRLPEESLNHIGQFAQALQWVRCYQYQSCDDLNWTTTFAYHYTQRLVAELQSKIIACFATSWVYDGPPLT